MGKAKLAFMTAIAILKAKRAVAKATVGVKRSGARAAKKLHGKQGANRGCAVHLSSQK